MRKEVIKAIFVVFIASFCTMVIELVAGRIMAPYVGVSLYTWTSIIGVVLAGISIGAYVGGMLADRFPNPENAGVAALRFRPRGPLHFPPDGGGGPLSPANESDDAHPFRNDRDLFPPGLPLRDDFSGGGAPVLGPPGAVRERGG